MPGRKTRGVPGKRGLPADFQFGPSYPNPWFMQHPGAGGGYYDSSYSSSSDSGSQSLGLEIGG